MNSEKGIEPKIDGTLAEQTAFINSMGFYLRVYVIPEGQPGAGKVGVMFSPLPEREKTRPEKWGAVYPPGTELCWAVQNVWSEVKDRINQPRGGQSGAV